MNIIEKMAIRKFVKSIDKDIKVKFQKYDMECDVYDEVVYIGKTFDERTDKFFMNFVKELNPNCNYDNCFLLSLLHEIGHIMTWDEDDSDEKDVIYGLLRTQFDAEEIDDRRLQEYDNLYFRIPLELNATQWGIDFAMANPDIMKKYDWLGRK